MIFNPAKQTDLDKVADFFHLMLKSPVDVDRPLTAADVVAISIGCLNTGLTKAEACIAALEDRCLELEARLAEHVQQKRH